VAIYERVLILDEVDTLGIAEPPLNPAIVGSLAAATPELHSFVLFGLGAAGLAGYRWRQRRR
jgi:hypothetical protein